MRGNNVPAESLRASSCFRETRAPRRTCQLFMRRLPPPIRCTAPQNGSRKPFYVTRTGPFPSNWRKTWESLLTLYPPGGFAFRMLDRKSRGRGLNPVHPSGDLSNMQEKYCRLRTGLLASHEAPDKGPSLEALDHHLAISATGQTDGGDVAQGTGMRNHTDVSATQPALCGGGKRRGL